MGMCMAARPSISWPRLALALVCAALLACAAGASPAFANAGKVLVFTGTTGTANPVSADASSAIQALGAANDFTVDVTADANQVNATNLAGYRAVVFVNSVGDVLNAAQETDLQNYVQTGGGFVGIGDTALLEQGGATFFNTLIGLAAARVSGTATVTPQDVEFLDRVHPATRSNPMLWKGVSEKWYTWGTNPTGTVHTGARVRFNTIPDGSSVPNDAVRASTTNQPQGERAAAWCRDIQLGRSFYSEIGGSSTAWADQNLRRLTLGGIQWAAGMVRGNCKATINSNRSATRVTPPNPSATSNIYTGEMTKSALADDGRIFYGGRAICYQNYVQITNWDTANTGLGCGTIHVWDPRVDGSNNQNSAKIAKVASLSVFGAKAAPRSTVRTPRLK